MGESQGVLYGRVALISSGDAGVYGMAGLVFEVLRDMGWKRGDSPDLRIVPGMTAPRDPGPLPQHHPPQGGEVTEDLIPAYAADCPAAMVHKGHLPGPEARDRDLGRHPRQGEGGRDPLAGHDPGRPGAGGDRLRRLAPLRPGLQPPVSQGQAPWGKRMTRVVPASDRARSAPTAAARHTGLAYAGAFQCLARLTIALPGPDYGA